MRGCKGLSTLSSKDDSTGHISGNFGPTPKWDVAQGVAIDRFNQISGPPVQKGTVNKVIWMCWTGSNPIPAHLELCKRTVERNAGLPVILVTPKNILQYVPKPHPGYEFLHLAHRADYLRCCLLHFYGGVYLDMDTICLQTLAHLFGELDTFDAVGYDGTQWGELVGISDMGPFRPGSKLTELWFNALHGKMQERLADMRSAGTDVFYWQEILRDLFVPASLMHKDIVSKALTAFNPEQNILWSTESADSLIESELSRSHILILNNAKYGNDLDHLTEEQILAGPAVLSQILRKSLGVPSTGSGI